MTAIDGPCASRGEDHGGSVDIHCLTLAVETPDAADPSVVTGKLGDLESGEDMNALEGLYQLRQPSHEGNAGNHGGIRGNDTALRAPFFQEHPG